MLGFFRSNPTCPIEPQEQQWVDGRFRWLLEQLGQDVPRNCRVILPTEEFFPDRYEGKQEDANVMFARVAGYMNVDAKTFELFFYNDQRQVSVPGVHLTGGSSAAGLYFQGQNDSTQPRRPKIGISAAQLADPIALVSTLAHEIGHEILLGQNRVSRDQSDHEPLTDLLTVFLGLGVFTANATIRDKAWSRAGWHGWQTSRLGYLDQRLFGYALARFAWTRGELAPPWLKYVRPDVRAPLKQGAKFLRASNGG